LFEFFAWRSVNGSLTAGHYSVRNFYAEVLNLILKRNADFVYRSGREQHIGLLLVSTGLGTAGLSLGLDLGLGTFGLGLNLGLGRPGLDNITT
jgi:hypothetical protein